jgi:uncharacterized protein YjiS (DUF1127 family)
MNANLTVSTSNPSSLASFAAFRLADVIERVGALLSAWHQRAADRRQLRGLDEHMLHDIGLFRGDVEFEINKPFWRG